MHVEEIIDNIWTFGLYQKIMMVIVLGPRGLLGWSMLVMSFAGTVPDWWCVPETDQSEANSTLELEKQMCYRDDNITCTRVFSEKYNTIVNQWDLVCSRKWITPSITSIQIVGVLFGALIAGQLAEVFGRRKSHFGWMLVHAVFNIVAGFSVSWQMFAVMRFFLGLAVGAMLVVSFTFYMEFIGKKWRSLCSGMPFWSIGVCLFALAAWITPDWSNLHIICGVLHIPFILGWFFVPESIRWLAVNNYIPEAESVVARICKINKRPKPDHTLGILKLVADEAQHEASGKKYTYFDVFRGWSRFKMSLIIDLQWMCLGFVYYGILFGVDALSGDLCLNIFLMSVVDIPADIATLYLNNRFGRKYTYLGYMMFGVTGAISVIIVTIHGPAGKSGLMTTLLAMVAKIGVGSGWTALQVLTSESYPTVMRNLGYGAAGVFSRFGAVVSPFIFALGGKSLIMPFVVVSVTMGVCITLGLFMHETKDSPLEDTVADDVAECQPLASDKTAAIEVNA